MSWLFLIYPDALTFSYLPVLFRFLVWCYLIVLVHEQVREESLFTFFPFFFVLSSALSFNLVNMYSFAAFSDGDFEWVGAFVKAWECHRCRVYTLHVPFFFAPSVLILHIEFS